MYQVSLMHNLVKVFLLLSVFQISFFLQKILAAAELENSALSKFNFRNLMFGLTTYAALSLYIFYLTFFSVNGQPSEVNAYRLAFLIFIYILFGIAGVLWLFLFKLRPLVSLTQRILSLLLLSCFFFLQSQRNGLGNILILFPIFLIPIPNIVLFKLTEYMDRVVKVRGRLLKMMLSFVFLGCLSQFPGWAILNHVAGQRIRNEIGYRQSVKRLWCSFPLNLPLFAELLSANRNTNINFVSQSFDRGPIGNAVDEYLRELQTCQNWSR